MSSDALSKLALRQQLDLESPTRPSCSVQGPFLFGNDTDSVDVATRVAMTKFFSSDNLFGNFENHTRTLRLYPRPIVTIQAQQLLNSRTKVNRLVEKPKLSLSPQYGVWKLQFNKFFPKVHFHFCHSFTCLCTHKIEMRKIGDGNENFSRNM